MSDCKRCGTEKLDGYPCEECTKVPEPITDMYYQGPAHKEPKPEAARVVHNPHEGLLNYNGETWVTLKIFEQMRKDRDEVLEQLESKRGFMLQEIHRSHKERDFLIQSSEKQTLEMQSLKSEVELLNEVIKNISANEHSTITLLKNDLAMYKNEFDESLKERDKLRAALEQIAHYSTNSALVKVARQALGDIK